MIHRGSVEETSIDHQCREKRGLALREGRFPAWRGACPVEVRLVSHDPACDRGDPTPADGMCKRLEAGGCESRVAVALQDQVAAPRGTDELPLAENIGRGSESGTKTLQSCGRKRQLLGRRGLEGCVWVESVDNGVRGEVDDDDAGQCA